MLADLLAALSILANASAVRFSALAACLSSITNFWTMSAIAHYSSQTRFLKLQLSQSRIVLSASATRTAPTYAASLSGLWRSSMMQRAALVTSTRARATVFLRCLQIARDLEQLQQFHSIGVRGTCRAARSFRRD